MEVYIRLKKKKNVNAFKFLSLLQKIKTLENLKRMGCEENKRIIKKLLELEKNGIVEFDIDSTNSKLKELYRNLNDQRKVSRICKRNAGFWNLVGEEIEWIKRPKDLDYLSIDSPFNSLKTFEREIYFNLINPYLKNIKKNSLILDAGGGIGRFTIELAKMGYRVHLVDFCKTSLKKAIRHALEKKLIERIDFWWEDINNLSVFPDNYFDAVFAIEVICYCANPLKALKELVRVTRKGGLLFISVEGKYGSMLVDPRISLREFESIYYRNKLCIKNDVFVNYYTKEEFKKLIKKARMKVLSIKGCHYVADGIFHEFLSEKNYEKLLKIEKICRKDQRFNRLARAWLGIGEK